MSRALDGALLIDKPDGISAFGVIEILQETLKARGLKRSQWPKLGHGGTLDPFATGLMVVLVGDASKLARYFLGANKAYEGTIRFGETTVPGDPTAPVSETSAVIPESIEKLREMASKMSAQGYLQVPPMHSAKKKDGKPLYELARAGVEIERDPVLCHLHRFEILNYTAPRADFRVFCSSGTYVRTLAQDFSRLLGTVGLLERLRRTASGSFQITDAWTPTQITEAEKAGTPWNELPCWIPFDRLLAGYDHADATEQEAEALVRGKQNVLFPLLKRATRPHLTESSASAYPGRETCLAIYHSHRLIAVARQEERAWRLERVFARAPR